MIKNETIKLDNGLLILASIDTSKNIRQMELITKIGGITENVISDGQEINIKNGTAHFLEHTLIECSPYGNFLHYMDNFNASANGYTTEKYTSFTLRTVKDEYTHLEELLTIVNHPVFDDLEGVKNPIIEEINRKKNYILLDYNIAEDKQLFGFQYNNALGEVETIKNMTKEYLMKVYEALYVPNNQILLLSGNFDLDKVVEIVNQVYSKYNKQPKGIIINEPVIQVEPFKKEDVIKLDYQDPHVSFWFKMDKNNFTEDELRKLYYFASYWLKEMFDDRSDAYKYIVENGICEFSISRSVMDCYNLFGVGLEYISNRKDELLELTMNTLKNYQMNKEKFELDKKRRIMNIIDMNDHVHEKIISRFNMYLEEDRLEDDILEFIQNITYEDGMNLYHKLNFDNLCITVLDNENN